MSSAWAHPSGVTVTDLYIGAERVELVYTVPTADLWRIEGGEQPDNPRAASHYQTPVRQGFQLRNAADECDLTAVRAETLAEIDSYEYRLRFQCPRPLTRLHLTYQLFVSFDRAHRNLVRVYIGNLGRQVMLHSKRRELTIPVEQVRREQGVELVSLAEKPEPEAVAASGHRSFFRLGVEHILGGYDHLLFLAGLLLLAQRLRTAAIWVTAFTVAHSITLSLAVLGVINLPAVITESLIALSVAWVGALNLVRLHVDAGGAGWRRMPRVPVDSGALVWRRWWLTFGFGLIHGLGFAAVLREAGLAESNRIASLAWFNVGVEAGQLAVVVLVYPVLRWCARWAGYSVGVSVASVGLVLVGLGWFFGRVLVG
ncbi:HupE/UreJ family protein [Saccharospirillum salsuginis]|nr:HupE/UreJ family protein [Saccharospirillum salsuginis]